MRENGEWKGWIDRKRTLLCVDSRDCARIRKLPSRLWKLCLRFAQQSSSSQTGVFQCDVCEVSLQFSQDSQYSNPASASHLHSALPSALTLIFLSSLSLFLLIFLFLLRFLCPTHPHTNKSAPTSQISSSIMACTVISPSLLLKVWDGWRSTYTFPTPTVIVRIHQKYYR